MFFLIGGHATPTPSWVGSLYGWTLLIPMSSTSSLMITFGRQMRIQLSTPRFNSPDWFITEIFHKWITFIITIIGLYTVKFLTVQSICVCVHSLVTSCVCFSLKQPSLSLVTWKECLFSGVNLLDFRHYSTLTGVSGPWRLPDSHGLHIGAVRPLPGAERPPAGHLWLQLLQQAHPDLPGELREEPAAGHRLDHVAPIILHGKDRGRKEWKKGGRQFDGIKRQGAVFIWYIIWQPF